jgi:uroporphyrinogen decarboxylase
MRFFINPACWRHYPPQALEELIEDHPFLFPKSTTWLRQTRDCAPWQRAGVPFTDSWGCVWETTEDGITGTVTRHPLEDWSAFDRFKAPDPRKELGRGPADWDAEAVQLREAQEGGMVPVAGLRHGHTFLTLMDLRGYENLIYDMTDEHPRLGDLIQTVEDFNLALVRRYIELGARWLCYPEDLGMQMGPMLSRQHFLRYIKPSYERIMQPATDAGCIIHMHSDGDIRQLADDLLACNVQVINMQDLVNDIGWTRDNLVGRVCIELDIDRQTVTPSGTPAQIDALIHEEVRELGGRDGGLMMVYGLYPGVPLENVKAIMDAMVKYATYYS